MIYIIQWCYATAIPKSLGSQSILYVASHDFTMTYSIHIHTYTHTRTHIHVYYIHVVE
jgi:hypothetical protein